MSFSFSLKPGTVVARKKISNPFGESGDDSETEESSKKPLDYVKARLDSEQRRAALAAAEARHDEIEEEDDEKIEDEKISDRVGVPLGPAAMGAKGSTGSSFIKNTTVRSSSSSMSRPGLVKLDSGDAKSAEVQKQPKHIHRMVETSQVNEKFKNLLKIKIAEKEKAKAEEEFGTKPEEFVTSAYLKQRQESLALEQELQAKESSAKKRDMTNLFREMLDSGSYARSNFHDPNLKIDTAVKIDKSEKSVSLGKDVDVSPELVQKVLEKIVPEESKQVAKAIEERTRIDVMKIVEQVENIVGKEDGEDDAEERRMSAKERYLQRKRQKLNEQ